jgi:solute carrier family 25 carnitine/acylcarnitine transporter 20/29
MENFLIGAVSGTVGVTLSHPFDTIKTCIQGGKPISMNPKFLYKGFVPPLFGVGFEKAVVFGTYKNVHCHLKKGGVDNRYAIPISGALSGLAASLVVTPVERIKILLQTDSKVNYRSLRPGYLFRGLSATFTRETPGFAIYFSFFELAKYRYYTSKDLQITKTASFVFGGLSGGLAWVFIFPQDCIKTRMQAQASATDKKSFTTVVNEIYRSGGFRGFYRGFHYALMRAVPLHAGTFMTYEVLNSLRCDPKKN